MSQTETLSRAGSSTMSSRRHLPLHAQPGVVFPLPLKPQSYKIGVLAERVAYSLPLRADSILTDDQLDARQAFQTLLANSTDKFRNIDHDDPSILYRFFKIFLKFFFPNQDYRPKYTIKWAPRLFSKTGRTTGITQWKRNRVRILLDPRDNLPTHQRQEKIIRTLLHETCHWFLRVFSCRCNACLSSLGKSGHASPWQHLAAKVEEAANNNLPVFLHVGCHEEGDERELEENVKRNDRYLDRCQDKYEIQHQEEDEMEEEKRECWNLHRYSKFVYEMNKGGPRPSRDEILDWFTGNQVDSLSDRYSL